MRLPSQTVAMCMPTGNIRNIREIRSESGKQVIQQLLDRFYKDGKPIDFRHVPAMLRLSTPGALSAWNGVILGYARDGYG